MQRARLTGCFNGKGGMVAGYAINHMAPFRCLDVIPAEIQSEWLTANPIEKQCELTFIWRTPGIGHLAFALLVWTRIVWDSMTAGKSYILGLGYRNPVNRYYGAANPVIIFEGCSPILQTDIFIYAYTPSSIGLTYCVNFVRDLIVKPVANLFGSKRSAGRSASLRA